MSPTPTVLWYETLAKPAWAPQPWVFGTVWSVLYPIIFAVVAWVALNAVRGTYPVWLFIPLGLNLASNFAYTPVMFGMRNLWLSEAIIVVCLATIVWSMIALWPHSRVSVFAFAPYLIWVAIATALHTSITLLNR